MSAISDFRNPWRNLLISTPASFRGVIFHVEAGGRSSGRRSVAHEYPKRNLPYTEDMGRMARRFQISGYLIYKPRASNDTNALHYDYVQQRNRLYEALEADDYGRLVHPVFAPNGGIDVIVERYSMNETRERGGFTQFEMMFVEYGAPVKSGGIANLVSAVGANAKMAEQTILDLVPKDI